MKCKQHKDYKAIRKPRANCEPCWRMYIEAQRAKREVDQIKLVEFEYPNRDDNGLSRQYVQIELTDVRASDGIRVRYDFGRNGWVVEQASIFSWPSDDTECNEDWQEVAYIESWGREITKDDK